MIGTGSSAIQAIPVIAQQAAQVTVFQRTPNFSIPSRNGPMTEDYAQSWKSNYPALREQARHVRTGVLTDPNDQSALEVSDAERQRVYEDRWADGGTKFMAAFNDLIFDRRANDTASDFVRDKIRATVRDQATAELLAPKNHPIGTKRICVDTDYYGTYNRPNVTLVDVRSTPISEITAHGLRTGDTEYAFDAIVFATGFDAMTGALLKIDISADGADAAGQVGGGAVHVSRPDDRGLSQHVHDHRAGQPVGAQQHDGVDRAARRLDRRLRGVSALARAGLHRGDAGGRRRVGRSTATRWRTRRCTRWRTPGTWASTSPASRRCSCRISAASAPIGDTCADIAADGYRGFELTARTAAMAAE